MKPGGKIIATAPFFYEEHEQPYDFYRYTQFGWRHLMATSGFEIDRLEWMEGYFGTVAYQLSLASRCLPKRPSQISPGLVGVLAAPVVLISKVAFDLLARLFNRLDERARFVSAGLPKNYLIVAHKR